MAQRAQSSSIEEAKDVRSAKNRNGHRITRMLAHLPSRMHSQMDKKPETRFRQVPNLPAKHVDIEELV